MSLSRPKESQQKNNNTLEGGASATAAASSSSSSWNRQLTTNTNSFPPLPPHTKHTLEDSDEDMFTVPDVEASASQSAHSEGTNPNSNMNQSNVNDAQLQTGKRGRGRNPVDKEYRRLKRLLRNRVSAQQARERKKVYVTELESRAKELEDKNSNLDERISTLMNENTMLRKVLMNTRPKVDETTEA